MNRKRLIIIPVLLLALLSACGQKGALYLPEEPGQATPVDKTSDSSGQE